MNDERTTESHPTYGMLRISRVTHGPPGANLYGSSIRHHNTIEVTIKRGIKERNLHHDWYYGREELIQIALSPAQFAEAITSLNMGDGVPCTISHVGMVDQGECPEVNMRQEFEAEHKADVKQAFDDMQKLADSAAEILSKKSLVKADREAILDRIEGMMRHLRSNMPFVQNSFNEAMDDVVQDAKAEVEAFCTNKVQSLGLQALQAQGGNPFVELPVSLTSKPLITKDAE